MSILLHSWPLVLSPNPATECEGDTVRHRPSPGREVLVWGWGLQCWENVIQRGLLGAVVL